MLRYFICLLVLGVTAMVMELSVGRAAQTSPLYMYGKLSGKKKWNILGGICLIGNFSIMAFYTVVSGWLLYYFVKSLRVDFAGASPEAVTQSFSDMLGNAPTMMLWMVIICLIGFAVCFMGMQNGIEKIFKEMMSAVLSIMVVLAVHSVMMEGAGEGISFYLVPDFQKIKDLIYHDGNVHSGRSISLLDYMRDCILVFLRL